MKICKKLNKKGGSAEIVAIVILVAIAGILAISIGYSNSDSLLEANKMAQDAISLLP